MGEREGETVQPEQEAGGPWACRRTGVAFACSVGGGEMAWES